MKCKHGSAKPMDCTDCARRSAEIAWERKIDKRFAWASALTALAIVIVIATAVVCEVMR